MQHSDIRTLAQGMAPVLRGYIDELMAPLIARNADLERRLASAEEQLRAVHPAPTVDVDQILKGFEQTSRDHMEAVRKMAASDVAEFTAPLIECNAALEARVLELEARAPVKGDPGEPGKDAEPITYQQIAEAVAAYLAEHPPADGKDGQDGKDGLDGAPGEPGRDGLDGKDAAQLVSFVKDATGQLIITLSDGRVVETGVRDGLDGKDGQDGKDGEKGDPGFSLSDFDTEIRDGGRTLVLSFEAGDIRHTVEHQLDTMIYRGAYKAGQAYEPGDTVSCGGQLHHCNQPTTDRPDGGSAAWTLCSRRGRDGKDADPAPLLRLIEDKSADTEERLMKRLEAFLRSKGLI